MVDLRLAVGDNKNIVRLMNLFGDLLFADLCCHSLLVSFFYIFVISRPRRILIPSGTELLRYPPRYHKQFGFCKSKSILLWWQIPVRPANRSLKKEAFRVK